MVLFFLVILGSAVGWVVRDRTARQTEAENKVSEALAVAEARLRDGNPRDPQLVSTAHQAEAQLASGLIHPELRQRVVNLLADLKMLETLEEIRLAQAGVKDVDWNGLDTAYMRAFLAHGIDVDVEDTRATGALIGAKASALHLAAALDDWAQVRRTAAKNANPEKWQRLLEVASVADPDPWRVSLRQALARGGAKKDLEQLAASAPIHQLPPATLICLATALIECGAIVSAVEVLRQAQWRHPADLWINTGLATILLQDIHPPQPDEAIGYLRAVLALRPDGPAAHANLGMALHEKGQLDLAIAAYREAIRLQPNHFVPHHNLGGALTSQGKPNEAIASFLEALRLNPGIPAIHNGLGTAMLLTQNTDAAIAAYREALRLNPLYAKAHSNLGLALNEKGQLDEAIDAHREAVRLKPDDAEAYNLLGAALNEKGQWDEAIAAFREAVRLQPKLEPAHSNLGGVLALKGQYAEAIAAQGEALRLTPDSLHARNNLAWLLATCAEATFRDPARAVELAKKAVELIPQARRANPLIEEKLFWGTLGTAYYRFGDSKAAITALEKSVKLGHGGTGYNWFFLAMAHWQLGDKDQATKYHKQAIEWMDKHGPQNEELRRFRLEASELMGIREKNK